MPLDEIQDAIGRLSTSERKALTAWMIDNDKPAGSRPPKAAVPPHPPTLRRAIGWTILSLFIFFLIDAAIFRSGWYLRYVEPNSTAGEMELHLLWVKRSTPTVTPEVMVVGDSRIAEGLSARVANASLQNRLHLWNMGIGGSSPRTWYYLIRDADPTRTRFAAIAMALDHYSDIDGEPLDARDGDTSYVIGRLRLSDCIGFARSMRKPDLIFHVLAGCLFKGLILRQDVKDLLNRPSERLRDASDWRKNGFGYIDGYTGKPEQLNGLTVNFSSRTIDFPPGLTGIQKSTIKGTLLPDPDPQTGELTSYRQLWLGKILDLYKNSRTQLIFIEIPRAPLHRPDSAIPARFIDSLRNRKNVHVLPKETFRNLEQPELFADGLHLNHVGRPLFSEQLAAQIAAITGTR